MSSRLFAAVKSNGQVLGGLFKRDSREAAFISQESPELQQEEESKLFADAHEGAKAPVVAVMGAKGGVGASTVALNLAAASAGSLPTTLVDAHWQIPDITNLVGCEASHSLLELISRGDNVDRLLFDACRTEFLPQLPQLGVLLPPSSGDAFLQSNLSQLAACLEQIKTFNGLFVVDVPNHLDKHLVTLLDSCDRIVLVFEATISGVAACQHWLKTFAELGYADDKVLLVVNRAGSKHKLVEDQMGACFAGRACWKVPNASTITWDSSNRGVPTVLSHAGSQYGRAVTKLSEDLLASLGGK